MEPIIILDGIQLNPPNADGSGYDTYDDTGLGLPGWYGSPAKRTASTPLPYGSGDYISPGYDDQRTIGITGTVQAANRGTLIGMQRALSAICPDPAALYPMQVTDEAGTLTAQVRRSAAVLFKSAGDTAAQYSLSVIAPEPRLLDAVPRSVSTLMAQPGAGGVQWNGPAGASGTQWNAGTASPLNTNTGFESGILPWTVSGCSVAHSSAQRRSGAWSAQLTPDGTSGQAQINSTLIPVTAGQKYAPSAWVRFTAAVTSATSVSINWFDITQAFLSASFNYVSAPASTWTQLLGTYTAPVAAAYAQIVVALAGTPPSSNIFYVDDVLLVPSNVVGGVSWGQPGPTGVVTVDNTAGTAPADLLITIRGPAQNPAVSTATQRITYNGVLGASDVLAIDTGSGSVLLNGVNRRPYLTSANFFQIPAQSTLDIRFTCDVQNPTALMTASWQVSYL